MNPLRKRFTGDSTEAQRYTGEAMGLLDVVYDQMRLGGLSQLQMHRVLGNGVEVFAASRFGQDEIRVHVTPRPRPGGGRVRSYCVWEDDQELFTVPMLGPYINGPHTASKSVQFGGETREVNNVRQFNVHTLGTDFSFESTFSPLVDTPGENPTSATTVLYVQPDLGTKKFHAAYGTLYGALETVGFYLWDDGEATATEIDRVTDFPSHATGSFPGTGPMKGFGAYYKSPSVGGGKYYNTSSGDGPANNINPPKVAKFSPSGDVFEVFETFFQLTTVKKVGVASGEYADLGLPPGVSGIVNPAVDIAIQNDNKTVWMMVTDAINNGELKLYRYADSWSEINVEDGFGIPAVTVTNVWVNNATGPKVLPIMHDPITDAVCAIKGDYSGAWIFNARDCNGAPLGTFFRKFENIPVNLNPVYSGGFSYDPAFVNYVSPVQFYNGRIYVRYSSFDHSVAANFDIIYSNIGACYKVGRVLQKKQTNVE